MAHAQKPDLVFKRNGRVHLNRRGCQFSRLLAAEECGSADSNCIDRVPTYSARLLATHSIRIFPLHFPYRASPCAIRFWTRYTTKTLYAYFCPSCDPNTRLRDFRLLAAVQLRHSFFCDVIKRRLVVKGASEEPICPIFKDKAAHVHLCWLQGQNDIENFCSSQKLLLSRTVGPGRWQTALGFSDTAEQPRFYYSCRICVCARACVYCYSPILP